MKLFVRFCDNVWTFILRDVEFRDVEFDSWLFFLSAKLIFIILLKYVNPKYICPIIKLIIIKLITFNNYTVQKAVRDKVWIILSRFIPFVSVI